MAEPIRTRIEKERKLLGRARAHSYRKPEKGDELSIHFYFPKDFEEHEQRPCLLFFHGGMWDRGSVVQFIPHALYYVERGAVCGLVEYQTRATHPESTPGDSLQDAAAAVEFARENVELLRFAPSQLVGVGASAGANLVGCLALGAGAPPSAEREADGSTSHSSVPDAVVLFSAIIDIEKGSHAFKQCKDPAEARRLSFSAPSGERTPPMLMIHGTADRLVPFSEAEFFAETMKRHKAPFELIDFEGRDQNFFNFNTDPLSYEAALRHMDDFLDRHRILARRSEDEDPFLLSWRDDDY